MKIVVSNYVRLAWWVTRVLLGCTINISSTQSPPSFY
nr:MAG TPA: hypothetical protein [Bacteriophage sp.]